jgi:hypothetical protein
MDLSDIKTYSNSQNFSDFTTSHYRELCNLSTKHYAVVDYCSIPWGKRFVLWRHDLDFSLNRGLALARIENEIGIKATYFLNIHSEFYNLAETNQHKIVKEILELGHDIGLHFYAGFFDEITEDKLHDLIAREAEYLEWLFNVKPVAFSFHNPVESTLEFDADTYGGLLNCYSKRFKTEVSYCSDSNGYWRFRRLYDVLNEGIDPCLQILTHPGWWQEVPLPPRQRVFRCAFGRASAIMRQYDEALMRFGRSNQIGEADALNVIKETQPNQFQLCDYLWNQGEFQTLFLELWRIHELQIIRLCKVSFIKEWDVPANEVNLYFSNNGVIHDGWILFNTIFGISVITAASIEDSDYKYWSGVRKQIINGRLSIEPSELVRGCVFVSEAIRGLALWGSGRNINYDGLKHFSTIGLLTIEMAEKNLTEVFDEKNSSKTYPNQNWKLFKDKMMSFKIKS